MMGSVSKINKSTNILQTKMSKKWLIEWCSTQLNILISHQFFVVHKERGCRKYHTFDLTTPSFPFAIMLTIYAVCSNGNM